MEKRYENGTPSKKWIVNLGSSNVRVDSYEIILDTEAEVFHTISCKKVRVKFNLGIGKDLWQYSAVIKFPLPVTGKAILKLLDVGA